VGATGPVGHEEVRLQISTQKGHEVSQSTAPPSTPLAMEPDRTPPEGWRTAFGINGWHAGRWVTGPDGELRIAYVHAPSWNALLASISLHEAALAIAAEEASR
jgi:hypothetical protein